MPLSQLSQDLKNINYTVVDNVFISQYLPDAPPKSVDVYIYGLYLATNDDNGNTIDIMQRALAMEFDDILNSYMYWEELGIVQIVSQSPLEVVYLPLKNSSLLLKKIKPSKYTSFNKQIQQVLNSRMITPTEYNEYYLFLESTLFDPMALISVAKYCKELKGGDISYNYILTVARNLNTNGLKTFEAVEEKLSSQPKNNDDLLYIFKALSIKKTIDYADRQMFDKWISDYGFELKTVHFVAKLVTKGGMNVLDSKLGEYYKINKLSIDEIIKYQENKDSLISTAKSINKIIGVYYQSLDYIIEQYVLVWQGKGFDEETLLMIAKYCFASSIRTLEGMNEVILKFVKKGLISTGAITQYLEEVSYTDKLIKQVLDVVGVARNINNGDRTSYKLFTNTWQQSQQLILFAAEKSLNTYNPMQYLTKLLSTYYANKITTVEQAKDFVGYETKSTQNKQTPSTQRDYSKDEITALFSNLDD